MHIPVVAFTCSFSAAAEEPCSVPSRPDRVRLCRRIIKVKRLVLTSKAQVRHQQRRSGDPREPAASLLLPSKHHGKVGPALKTALRMLMTAARSSVSHCTMLENSFFDVKFELTMDSMQVVILHALLCITVHTDWKGHQSRPTKQNSTCGLMCLEL